MIAASRFSTASSKQLVVALLAATLAFEDDEEDFDEDVVVLPVSLNTTGFIEEEVDEIVRAELTELCVRGETRAALEAPTCDG